MNVNTSGKWLPVMLNKAKRELDRLMLGNRNFVNGTPTEKNMSVETLQKFAFHQAPDAMVLSCSDSRAVPEIIFDCGIGELFVIRVGGIAAGPNVVESIEYGVKKLKLPLLILLGHDDCGVMHYACDSYPSQPENFESIMNCVYPVFEKYAPIADNNDFSRKHTFWVEQMLLERSKVIKEAVENRRLYIAKCHLDHLTGKVEILNSI